MPTNLRPSLWERISKISRDTILFVAGLAGVLHETLVTNEERVYLLMLFAGMMGLPVFLRKDEEGDRGQEDKSSSV